MNRKRPPQEVASKLCNRSSCNVQVGAVLVDRHGRIFAGWWNHAGPDGLGRHAEEEAIRRRYLPISVNRPGFFYVRWIAPHLEK